MVERLLFDIVKQGLLDTILEHNVDTLAKFIGIIDALTRRVVSWTSFIAPIKVFAKKQVDRMGEEVRF